MKKIIRRLFLILVIGAGTLIYCYYNYQFWTHYKTNNFEVLKAYRGSNIKGLRGEQILIHKDFVPYISQINSYAKENDVKLIINQSYRSENQSVVRAVVRPGTMSNHMAGCAIDFNIVFDGQKYFSNNLKRKNLTNQPENIQTFINSIRANNDLRWGGDFNNEDPIHIDYPINIIDKAKWQEYKIACEEDFTSRKLRWKFW